LTTEITDRRSKSLDKLIYLITKDQQFSAFISQQLLHFGYFVQEVSEIKTLENAIGNHPITAILIDITSDFAELSEGSSAIKLFDLHRSRSPVIFFSDIDNQLTRLKSIRLGGDAFFSKPVNIISLVDKLDSLQAEVLEAVPYRVLIIEDQQHVANYYQMILNMAGMNARVVLDSNEVLNHIRDFHPDLILLDIAMQGVNGIELAKIIRQIDEYLGIPIIFLSNEIDFSKRVEALNLGGDDFLIKPIKAAHMIAVVKSRLERLKTLRSYMIQDSLTNLLNHTSFRNILSKEVSRCLRQNSKLALAMLDLDHFKNVNDSFGHATGDRVLKSLARLLRQRLRSSDIIGRYGGEEFVTLLLDCEAQQAWDIMDEIRQSFAEIKFFPNDTSALSVTFSCGISTFPEFTDAKILSDAADQALYQAKGSGRNQIIIASHLAS
jgi:diguanylate cyclase (GGDEF)-like protein